MNLREDLWFMLLSFSSNDGETGGGDAGGEIQGKAGLRLGAHLLGHFHSKTAVG